MIKQGFTLVELAIVLVIIGLLVGGVLAGQELINQAKIRAIIKEYNSIQTSITTFRSIYSALPGDMKNAVAFWGAQAGGTTNGYDGTCAQLMVAATNTATCNGNGDGMIGLNPYSQHYYETFRAWHHLANAELVAGQFSGVTNGATWLTPSAAPGVNVMASGFSVAGWSFMGMGTYSSAGTWFPSKYGSILYFGGAPASGVTGFTVEPVMKPDMALGIDEKVDDGRPGTGGVMTFMNGFRPDCVVANSSAYDLSKDIIGCNLIFKTGF